MINGLLTEILFSEVARWKKEGVPRENGLDRLTSLTDVMIGEGIPKYYINYSDIPQIGINPVYMFGFTPHGIYGYPLTMEIYKKMTEKNSLYGSNRPYIVVFSVVNPDKVISTRSYYDDQLNADVLKLRERYSSNLPSDTFEIMDSLPLEELWRMVRATARYGSKQKPYAKRLMSSGDKKLDVDSIEWRKRFVELGYEGVIDLGRHIISPDISSQAVFFTPAAIEQEFIIYNPLSKASPHGIYFKNPEKNNIIQKEITRTEEEIEGVKVLASFLRSKTPMNRNQKEELLMDLRIRKADFQQFFDRLNDKTFFSGINIGSLPHLGEINGYDFRGSTFSPGEGYSGTQFNNCNFSGINFREISFYAMMNDNIFDNCNITECKFFGYMTDCSFMQTNIKKSDFQELVDCDLRGTKFDKKSTPKSMKNCKREISDDRIFGYRVSSGILVKEF